MPEIEHIICTSAALVDGGTGVRFKVSRWGTAQEEQDAFVIRHAGQVRAYLNRCGHIPVQLDWQPGEFFDFSQQYLICATHGALYGPESGRCISGRCAGKGLTPVPVIEREGSIYWIDEGQ